VWSEEEDDIMQRIPLVGYADRFSVRPGETIAFKVSGTSDQPYEARLVRVVSCDPNPDGPGIIEHECDAPFSGQYPTRTQSVHAGSYMTADGAVLDELESFTLLATIWPTTPDKGRQGVITRMTPDGAGGVGLAIDEDGACACLGGNRVAVGRPLIARRWYRIWMSYDAATRRLSVGQAALKAAVDADDSGVNDIVLAEAPVQAEGEDLLVAAVAGTPIRDHFNGKIEAPTIVGTELTPDVVAAVSAGASHDAIVAAWDFSQGIPGAEVVDRGSRGLTGRLHNLPARAMTGSRWDGSVMSWQHDPGHYAAIYFHDDDLYDCGWETDFTFTVPEDLKSGVYAARLRSAEGDEEMIPFFVPAPKGRPQSRLCVLVSSFTYTVYANIARGNTTPALKQRIAEWGGWPYTTDEHPEYGLSTYNYHSDGSGICYSSRHRPIITMRSATICYPDVPGSGLRHFAADAHLWYWLEKKGYDFDVITDDELHAEGVAAIAGYDVVTTASHPEYHTAETLDALEAFTSGGGRFMYLGGNGFYWKVAVSDEYPGAVEIRRGEGGIRAWAAEPGEYYNAFDGTYGGLWRRNGRPPQQLCGVGFTSQGEHRGDHYRRTEISRDPAYSWIFDGIEEDIIGDFGLSGGGAAGFELDRADPRLGTPRNAVVLATSEGHDEHFVLVPEDVLTNLLTWNGEAEKDLIRSDIVYFETVNDGAVFSVGSITFCGSLPVNDCDNNVSRMVANVLDRFLNREAT
jgi:N,N-dimethylformamidase